MEAPAETFRNSIAYRATAGHARCYLPNGSDDRHLCDFGNDRLDAPLDTVLHGDGRYRTATACTYQPDLDDAIRVALIHELDIPAIDMESRSDRLERSLDPFSDGRLAGRFS